ncbi:MAG: hypothetical protein M3178_18145 [Pseudomonadota bacterium]|nr:hypothetical protein [Pseudomonadota bacterium]
MRSTAPLCRNGRKRGFWSLAKENKTHDFAYLALALAQSNADRQPFDDKIISKQASDSQENKWHKELEVPIFRCMASRCQSGVVTLLKV